MKHCSECSKALKNCTCDLNFQLTSKVGRYIDAKIAWTECKQEHFRQLCAWCRKYHTCDVYGRYVEAWIALQNTYKKFRKK